MLRLLFNGLNTYTECLIKCVSVLAFVGIWHWGSLHYHSLILPSPMGTIIRLYQLFAYENGMNQLGITIVRAISGFVSSIMLASILGILAGVASRCIGFS